MAGDDNRDGIASRSRTHSPAGTGIPHSEGNFPVAHRRSVRYFEQLPPHPHLKRRSPEVQGEVKITSFPFEVFGELLCGLTKGRLPTLFRQAGEMALEPGRRVSERLDGKADPTDPLGASHHHQGTEWGFQLLKTKPAHVPFIIEEDVRIQKKLLLVCPRMWDSSTIQAPSVFTRKWASGRIRCTIKREGPSGCLQIFAEVRHRQQGSTRPRSGCSRYTYTDCPPVLDEFPPRWNRDFG